MNRYDGAESPAHRAGVDALAADGWIIPGRDGEHAPTLTSASAALVVRRLEAVNMTPEQAAEWWASVTKTARPGKVHGRFGDVDDCDACDIADEAAELRRCAVGLQRPDAWRITWEAYPGGTYPVVWIAEVNVTHHADLEKWARFWDLMEDGYLIGVRYVLVDRNGTRSEPWTVNDASELFYQKVAG